MRFVKLDNFTINSADDSRIILQRRNGNLCQLTIKNPQEDDNGEWKFTIQSGLNKTLHKYSHNIIVRETSTYNILIIIRFFYCKYFLTRLILFS